MHHEPDDPFDRSEFFEPASLADAFASQPAYPLVYRVSLGWKVVLVTIGLMIVVLSVLVIMYFGYISSQIRDETGQLVLTGLCAVFFCLGCITSLPRF